MQNNPNGNDKKKELSLIEAAKKDPAFFAPLYDAYYKPVFLFVYNRLRNKQDAADVTAQVFLKAMLNLGKYEHRGFPFSSWLYRIAFNEMNLLYREGKKYSDVEISERDALKLMEEISEKYSDESVELLLAILSEMETEQQDMIELRFFRKLSFREIGDMYGITEDNAKIKVYRIVDKLKSLFLEKYNGR